MFSIKPHSSQNKNDKNSIPLASLIPNAVTLIGLAIGLSAIRFAFEGEWLISVSLLLLAGFLDGVDGRLARFLNSTSEFGAQLDSLIDFVNFGVVPALITYLYLNEVAQIRYFDWALVLFFSSCMAFRLARFNVDLNNEDKDPKLTNYFFQGIPAPCGAALSTLPFVLMFQFGDGYFFADPKVIICYNFILAVLVSSTLPTISIKKIPLKNEFIYLTFLIFIILITGLLVEPWLTLAIVGITYIFSFPITTTSYLRIKYANK